jgi:hypothetical protein
MAKSKNTGQKLSRKYFSLAAAEKLLPDIEKIMKRVKSLDKALELLSSIEIEVYDDNQENLKKITKLNRSFHKLSHEFYANIEKLEDLGCVIKDIELGLIDFYSRFEGRDIFLCWKLGEKRIRFWHEIDTGYMGRKPIMELRTYK